MDEIEVEKETLLSEMIELSNQANEKRKVAMREAIISQMRRAALDGFRSFGYYAYNNVLELNPSQNIYPTELEWNEVISFFQKEGFKTTSDNGYVTISWET